MKVDDATRQLQLAQALMSTHGVPVEFSVSIIDKFEPGVIAWKYQFMTSENPAEVARAAHLLSQLDIKEFPFSIMDAQMFVDKLSLCEAGGGKNDWMNYTGASSRVSNTKLKTTSIV